MRVPVHDALDCIEQFLTDPCIKDEDFAWFGDNGGNPLALLSETPTYLSDCNTGSAFRDLIDQNGQYNEQLMGVIFYIDGASTGLFADLPVTILKMSLSCFTRKARMKRY